MKDIVDMIAFRKSGHSLVEATVKKKWPSQDKVKELREKTEDYFKFLDKICSEFADDGINVDDLTGAADELREIASWCDDWEDHFREAFGE